MKGFLSLSLFLLCFIVPILNLSILPPDPPPPEVHPICGEKVNKTQPLNYLGTSLISNSDDPKDLVLCPGDAFGDLNHAYVLIQNCNLTMYQKGKMIWSKGRKDYRELQGDCPNNDYCMCRFYLKRDGNLVLYQEEIRYQHSYFGWPYWDHKKHVDPIKTELTVNGQQVQLLRTLRNGTQRLFYIDENHQEFIEDMGEPRKIADKFIVKSHSDEDKTILRGNEYIGDLNGTYLLLQTNCDLLLFNKNKTVWRLTSPYNHETNCTLNIAQDNSIEISEIWRNKVLHRQSAMKSIANLEVVESRIAFDDHEPIIIQTLKNGSELTFYGGRLKIEEPTQIAQKALTANRPHKNGSRHPSDDYIPKSWTIPRMGYIGNLTGLHLLLEQNCRLVLANGKKKLWEFQTESHNPQNAVMWCEVQLSSWDIMLKRYPDWTQSLFEHSQSSLSELTLENDHIVVKKKRADRDYPDIFYAGQQTNGAFFQFIAQNSSIVSRTSYYAEILPKMGYIGDLNGVYVLLDKNCNLVLYNKTQVLWESGISLDRTSDAWHSCGLGLHDDGHVKISYKTPNGHRKTIWSPLDFPPHLNFGDVLKAEFSVSNGELWLTHTFRDGTINKEKAIKGTKNFTNDLAQSLPPPHSDLEKVMFCKERNTTRSLNYLGASLTSNSDDQKDIVLCPGDTFGDLEETYFTVKNCYLAMYHKQKKIWTSKTNPYYANAPIVMDEKFTCAFSLKRDGNLVVYKEDLIGSPWNEVSYHVLWEAQTNLNPVKAELRVKDQQIQIIQTFRDGNQRLFYTDENHHGFVEDLGTPIKIADKFIIKSHLDEDKMILRRNEYIGDLNGTHLILQSDCQLQLLNRNKTIWSFIPPFRHQMNCTLNIAEDNTIEISSLLTGNQQSIMKQKNPLKVVQSEITFEGDQSIIIQTLENGSELVFCVGPGLNYGLNLKREPRQIAPKTITTRKNTFELKRRDYIGNLTGLHLILEQNCSLVLANGKKKLWELQSEPPYYGEPLMECSLQLDSHGHMYLEREWASRFSELPSLLGSDDFSFEDVIEEVQLTLEDDQIKIRREHSNRGQDVFYAGPKTNGTFFQFIAQNSVIINARDESWIKILPNLGYIGDLNGVHTILENNCNWVLYNKTKILWESGSYLHDGWGSCALVQTRNRDLWISRTNWFVFRSSRFTEGSLFKEVLRTEVLVNNSGLWLIRTFKDGIVHKYQAIPGTNRFELVLKTYDFSFGLEL